MSELNLLATRPASIWHNNPSLVHLLGLSPLLAISDSLSKALALGVGLLVTSFVSAVTIRMLSGSINERWRYFWYCIVLASYTSLVVMVLQLGWYPLARELGVYPALIACNFALLLRMESFQRTAHWQQLMLDATRLGLGLLLALVLFATLRELLLYGAVFTDWQLLIPGNTNAMEQTSQVEAWFRFMALPPAAFILLGLLIALGNWLSVWKKTELRHHSDEPVTRARVTGALKGSGKNPG